MCKKSNYCTPDSQVQNAANKPNLQVPVIGDADPLSSQEPSQVW
jgi:hypothetical protein